MPRVYRLGLAFVLATLVAGPAAAQGVRAAWADAITQYQLDAWGEEEGLPQLSVFALAQTPDGYLWVGTEEGLGRFNGSTFTVFDASNVPALASGDRIKDLLVGPDGTLWIGGSGGLVRYRGGTFYLLLPPDTAMVGGVTTLGLSPQQEVLAGTAGGLYVAEGDSIRAAPLPAGLGGRSVKALLSDAQGRLWVGTDAGLWTVVPDRVTGAWRNTHTWTTAEGLPDDDVLLLHSDTTGRLWIGTKGGTAVWADGRLRPAADYGLPPGLPALAALEDADGSLWFGADLGWGRVLRLRAGQAERLPEQELPDTRVSALLLDREGSLWVGTEGEGLARLRRGAFTNLGVPEGLPDGAMLTAHEDAQGRLWVGTQGAGVRVMEGPTVTAYTTADGLPSDIVTGIGSTPDGAVWLGTYGGGLARLSGGVMSTFGEADGLPHPVVYALHTGPTGTLWAGTGGGVARYEGGRLTAYTTADGLASNDITAVYEDAEGALWVGTYDQGITRLHDGRATHLTTAQGLGSNTVTAFYQDADGVMWAGTLEGGLTRISEEGVFTFTRSHGLEHDIFQILEDEEQHLWLSSNKGLLRVSREALAAVAAGLEPAVAPSAFGRSDGLRTREMNGGTQPAGWRGRDGTLWFVTAEGIAGIHPDDLRRQEPPPVVIERVLVDRQELPPTQKLRLGPGRHRLEFHPAALALAAPDRIVYRYRLDGYERAWNEAAATDGRAPIPVYDGLPPGTYTLQVKARDRDGSWSAPAATFTFTIRPFVWQRPGFWVLVVCVLVAGGVSGHRFRIRHLHARQRALEGAVEARTRDLREAKERTDRDKALIEEQAARLRVLNEDLEGLVEEQVAVILREREAYEARLLKEKERAEAAAELKAAIVRNMSHELRTPLTAILGYADILREEVPGALKEFAGYVRQNAERLQRTLTGVLELSRIESGDVALAAESVDVHALAHEVASEHRAAAEGKGLQLRVDVPRAPLLVSADESATRRILQALVDNAIKFTDGGEVTITAIQHGDRVRVDVADTGVGISEEFLPHLFQAFQQESRGDSRVFEGSGLSLAVALALAEEMGGALMVASQRGRGSVFSVRLPGLAQDSGPASVVEGSAARALQP